MNDVRILGDWGGSRLRLWRVADGEVTDKCEGPGIIGLERPPAEVLLDLLAPWRADGAHSVTLCGMAGARGGLCETSYVPCPASSEQWSASSVALAVDGVQFRIAGGCASDRGNKLRDLMRGEETQVFGAMQLAPAIATGQHRLVLPGTHSKWVDIADGRIVAFRTYLTGEMFAKLRQSSLLPGENHRGEDRLHDDADAGFATGLAAARNGSGLLANLFLTRAAQVDGCQSGQWALAFLSGLLIGTECTAGMADCRDSSSVIRIVGTPDLAQRYAAVLNRFGTNAELLDADACSLSGLAIINERP